MSLLAWKPSTNQQQFSCIPPFADIIKPKYTSFLAKPPWKSCPLLAGIFAFCEYLRPPHRPPRRAGGPTCSGSCPTRARRGCVAPTPQPPTMPQKPHRQGGATRPPRPGHTAATALPVPVASRPAAVPSLRPTVPGSGNLPPQGRAEGWVPMRRAAACPRGPCGSALASGLCSEIFLSVQKPQRRVLHCCPQCHPQPCCELAAASVRSFGDRNSAAIEKFNPCRESPCSRLRKTRTGPSAAEPCAEEEKSRGGGGNEGKRGSHRRGVLGL